MAGIKKTEVWGQCPYRRSEYMVNGESFHGTWAGYVYFCDKIGSLCDPNYCLGPDSEKGDEKDED